MENTNIIENRLARFRAKLAEKGMDAALITKRESYIYLSGFTGTSAYLVITRDQAVLVTDFRYRQQASEQAPMYKIVQYQGSLLAELNAVIKDMNVHNVGFEDRHMTYSYYNECKNNLEIKELVPLGDMVESLRMVKDACEIESIKKAVKIADDAFTHILGFIKPGRTEMEVAAELEYFMKTKGASGASFETIVASGTRASMPHGVASGKKLEMGDVITLDFGALYEQYCSDMTRTVFLGDPGAKMKEIYGIVLEAQLEAEKGAKKGMTGKEIDSIARSIISDRGFGNQFGHGLGHGVGLEIHEEPRFSPSGKFVMENNMVVTVEPGIYIEGLGGVRIEDIIVISDDKPQILTGSTKEIIIL
ncbi:MAG: aminopeptidase P family protein [Clostridiales bacterium]|jgi:Xaa-Pro aminopeptidase|nr:aminopeptidase P family protein [Eubacteriales bacterium]MDH7565246.1 aminopeptidase P family protein [Clostridiales bacterium]